MKKSFVILLFFISALSISIAGQKDQKVLKESVTVVNVEVPVRVYLKGKPVDNLSMSDFRIFENGKKQDINGFILKKKMIKAQNLELNTRQEKSGEGRYFVLVFRITNYDHHLRNGLDYIFNSLLKESDQLLVFINNRNAFFKDLTDKETAKASLKKLLHDESMTARRNLHLYVKSVEGLVNKDKFEQDMRQPVSRHWMVEEYFRKFLEVWKSYKKAHLVPDINKYYNFAKFLKNIDKEKYVINFYQLELFPDIMINSESMNKIRREVGLWQTSDNPEQATAARIISRQLVEIEKQLSIAKDFPSAEVAKIFHNVDATFHSIFMKTSLSSMQQDMGYREVASELESSLRAITDLTGGELKVSNKLDTALEEISESEDVYYILTYSPDNPDKIGKIKVKLNNKKYKVVYSPNLRFGYLGQYLEQKETKSNPVVIKGLSFKKGKLKFTVSDFLLDKKKGGALLIRIRINDENGGSAFDQKKTIKADHKKVNISLNIKELPKGRYDVIVDITDLFTKSSGTETLKTKI